MKPVIGVGDGRHRMFIPAWKFVSQRRPVIARHGDVLYCMCAALLIPEIERTKIDGIKGRIIAGVKGYANKTLTLYITTFDIDFNDAVGHPGLVKPEHAIPLLGIKVYYSVFESNLSVECPPLFRRS